MTATHTTTDLSETVEKFDKLLDMAHGNIVAARDGRSLDDTMTTNELLLGVQNLYAAVNQLGYVIAAVVEMQERDQ